VSCSSAYLLSVESQIRVLPRPSLLFNCIRTDPKVWREGQTSCFGGNSETCRERIGGPQQGRFAAVGCSSTRRCYHHCAATPSAYGKDSEPCQRRFLAEPKEFSASARGTTVQLLLGIPFGFNRERCSPSSRNLVAPAAGSSHCPPLPTVSLTC
jgi:hypothetical protein